MKKIATVFMAVAVLFLFACSSGNQPTEQTESFFAMDTYTARGKAPAGGVL